MWPDAGERRVPGGVLRDVRRLPGRGGAAPPGDSTAVPQRGSALEKAFEKALRRKETMLRELGRPVFEHFQAMSCPFLRPRQT